MNWFQIHYRILVEILNENDNKPKFLEETIQPFSISEVKHRILGPPVLFHHPETFSIILLQVAAVNSVVFTVKAVDLDGDMISFIIDQSSVGSPSTSDLFCRKVSGFILQIKPVRRAASAVVWYLQEDAWFFRIDLPNSGKVVLNKPLDYESRTRLQIIMWAQVKICCKSTDE